MRLNTAAHNPNRTHEGAPAAHLKPFQQLRRSVLACLLWENEFYESGATIADRVKLLVPQCDRREVADLALYARQEMKLRHAPLLLLRELARTSDGSSLVRDYLHLTIQRADELTEFLALYWKDGKRPLAKQVQRGLADAFARFDAYQLGKYNRPNAIKLRDVLRLAHAKPENEQVSALWKQLNEGTLASPDTWEVALSGGADKRDTFERLLRERKLGYMALLRNLRNMEQAGVDRELIKQALLAGAGRSRVLPFRFVAAARACPSMVPSIDLAMQAACDGMEKIPGHTCILVDVSGSMEAKLSAKSDLTRIDAAGALSVLVREVCADADVWTFSNQLVQVPAYRGLALMDAISRSQAHGGTELGKAVTHLLGKHDRLIVVTDEQSHDRVPEPTKSRGYMINVASARNGVGYGRWVHIDGWSEAVIDFVRQVEQ